MTWETDMYEALAAFERAVELAKEDDARTFIQEHAPALLEATLEMTASVAAAKRQKVRELREAGHTIRKVAELVGLSYQRVQQIETGVTARDREKAKRVRGRS